MPATVPVAAGPELPSVPGGGMGPLVVEFPAGVFPVDPPARLALFPGSALPRMPWAGGRRVEPLGVADEPLDGDAEDDELLLEPPEAPCAHAAPAIRQPASSAVEIVR
ncbi:hypothetical protein [Microvirga sp. VF16]|uniref:hypothetical protein n=1 Tax=Microvirga sp. VF16 TaxID=2807101 RepID=UPI00193E5AEE|nr:hypothetical protein [Microvirga sp. VF16]QRM31254.1 hypothetical protein JO965_09795 [Microvirga sp. VF16]